MRGAKLVIGIVGFAIAAVVLYVAVGMLGVIAFGAGTRPWWSSAILLGVMVIVPVGASVCLLLRAVDSISANRLARSWGLLICALLCPALGTAIGIEMLSIRMLP